MTSIKNDVLEEAMNKYNSEYYMDSEDLRILAKMENLNWSDCKSALESVKNKSIEELYIHVKGAIGQIEKDPRYNVTKSIRKINQFFKDTGLRKSDLPEMENREKYINQMIDLLVKRVGNPYIPRQFLALCK